MKIKNNAYEYVLPLSVENDIFQQILLADENTNPEKITTENNKKVYRKYPKNMDDDYEIPSWVYKKVFKLNIPGVFKNKKQTLRNLNRML